MEKKYIVIEHKIGEDDEIVIEKFVTLKEAYNFVRENPQDRRIAKLIAVEMIEK